MHDVQIHHDAPRQKKKKISNVMQTGNISARVNMRDPVAFEGERGIWFPNHPHHGTGLLPPPPLFSFVSPPRRFPIQWSPFQTTCWPELVWHVLESSGVGG